MYKIFTKYFGKPLGYAKKFMLIMKVAVVIVLATILQVKAGTTMAQKVSLNEKKASLITIFNKIKAQSGYDFIYNEDLVSSMQRVDLSVKDVSVEEAVNKSIADVPLEFVIKNKVVVIRRKAIVDKPVNEIKFADTVISGKITDAITKQPIPGVTVSNKTKKSSVQTNTNGAFNIQGEKGDVLLFSYIGYKPKQITVISAKSQMSVTLEEAVNEMKDVVITGLFARKASTSPGSTTTFNQEELLRLGPVNVIQALRNLDPAFLVVDNNALGSDPNALPDIQVRGQSSLPDLNGEYSGNPNAPLFILDGFETSLQKVIDLDIYRIASITLLKDAASKAIYGSRAANGVLVIETLRPEGGKLQISYSNNINVQLADVSSYNLLNARQKLEAEVLAGVYVPANTVQSGGEAQYGLKEWYSQNRSLVEQGVNTDWLAKPLRNGIGQRHSLRLQGGDENMRYGVDVSNNNVLGVMKGSDRKTTAGALDLSYRKGKVIFTNILSVTNNQSNNSPWGAFSTYAAMNPYLPYYDEYGMIAKVINTTYRAASDAGSNAVVGTLVYNPAYNSTLGVVDKSKYTEVRNNFSGEYRILEGLMTRARFNVVKQFNTSDLFLPANHTTFVGAAYEGDNANRKGRYTKGNGETNNFSGNLFANYNKPIGKHLISSNIGVDYNHLSNFNNAYAVEGFPNDRMDFVSSALQYVLNTRPTGSENTVKDMSIVGAANYSYDDRYAADFSFRTTQSSNFGVNARWGQFWSLGAVWNAHRESFVRDLGFIDRLTFRASTGYTGSQNLSSSLTLATYTYILENPYLGSGNGATLVGLANPDLQWQRKLDNNYGIDLTVWRNKLSLRFDYYMSLTSGLITDITLPPSNGFGSYKANLGKSQNKGYDLRFSYLALNQPAKRTSLSFNFTLSHNKNILKNISNALQQWNASQDALRTNSNPKTRFIEGQSMSAIWAVPSLGIDPATGREVYRKQNGDVTYTWNAADQIAAGESLPKFSGNFGFNLQYIGFQLNTSFRYQLGGSMYNQTLVSKVENADIYKNVDARVLTQRWRNPGDVSILKNIADRSVTLATTRFLADNNILTMAALNLQYDLAEKVPAIKKWGISRMRPGLSISDQVLSSSIAVERGTSYPFSRNFQFSLQVSFN